MEQNNVKRRLQELRRELDTGRTVLAELETRKMEVKDQMLRINGAIRVLQELLADEIPEEETTEKPVAVGQ